MGSTTSRPRERRRTNGNPSERTFRRYGELTTLGLAGAKADADAVGGVVVRPDERRRGTRRSARATERTRSHGAVETSPRRRRAMSEREQISSNVFRRETPSDRTELDPRFGCPPRWTRFVPAAAGGGLPPDGAPFRGSPRKRGETDSHWSERAPPSFGVAGARITSCVRNRRDTVESRGDQKARRSKQVEGVRVLDARTFAHAETGRHWTTNESSGEERENGEET